MGIAFERGSIYPGTGWMLRQPFVLAQEARLHPSGAHPPRTILPRPEHGSELKYCPFDANRSVSAPRSVC